MILLDTPPKDAKAALSQLLMGKTDPVDSETFGKILKELSLSLGGGKGLSKEELALLLANEGKQQDTKIAPGLLLKLDDEIDPKAVKTGKTDESVLTLLHGDEEPNLSKEELEEIKMLHPKLTPQMPVKAVRELIEDAKTYLKTQLSDLVEEKELPKTLKGLVLLAEKKGIDITKITLEQAQSKQEPGNSKSAKDLPKNESVKVQPLLAEPKDRHTGIKNIPTEELVQSKQTQQPENSESKKESQPLRTLLQKEEPAGKPEAAPLKENIQTDKPAQPQLRGENRSEQVFQKPEQASLKSENRAEQTSLKSENRAEPAIIKSAVQTEPVKSEAKQETSASKTEQPLIQTEAKTDTAKHNGAKSGEQPTASLPSETAIEEVPKNAAQKPDFAASLTKLLQGDVTEGTQQSESENRSVETAKPAQTATIQAKSDGLELKINEAKQMVRHFAGEIKEAIQNYKPPFTRIKMQLNPVKLGEVDVTMVQRGNNVHINISSNSAAVNLLANNATELRTQLAQNGLNNATMNFNSSSNPEQQQQQQRQHLAELYEQFENSEEFDLLESLEIIVPRYV
ncbi:MAG: flagellar hook-length control protein FliK [Campylobacterota bacterium]|nr:flagellar hook-length control protein FliK [Campylobacterota bacterium]